MEIPKTLPIHQQPTTTKPQLNENEADQNHRNFKTRYYGCFHDMKVCCASVWCFPSLYGKIAGKFGFKNKRGGQLAIDMLSVYVYWIVLVALCNYLWHTSMTSKELNIAIIVIANILFCVVGIVTSTINKYLTNLRHRVRLDRNIGRTEDVELSSCYCMVCEMSQLSNEYGDEELKVCDPCFYPVRRV